MRFIDPDGMLSQDIINSLWNNSQDGRNTTWLNDSEKETFTTGDVDQDKDKEKSKEQKKPSKQHGSFIVFGDKFETAQTRKAIDDGLLDENLVKKYSDQQAEMGEVALFSMAPSDLILGWFGRAFGIGRNASTASVYDKLLRYILNLDHPTGGSKAKWFKEALGFTIENMDDLARQIVFDGGKAIETGATKYGTLYNQTIRITGANGRVIDVVFGWIKGNDGVAKLVTAIPTKL
jgi:hypothetical protein